MFLVQSFNSVPGARMFLRNLIRAACQLYYSNLSGVWIKLFVESKYVLRKVSTEDYLKWKKSSGNSHFPKKIHSIAKGYFAKQLYALYLLVKNLIKRFFNKLSSTGKVFSFDILPFTLVQRESAININT